MDGQSLDEDEDEDEKCMEVRKKKIDRTILLKKLNETLNPLHKVFVGQNCVCPGRYAFGQPKGKFQSWNEK